MALGKSLDVTAWLVPVLIERRGIVYLDVTFISAVTGAALFSRRQALSRVRGRRRTALPLGAALRGLTRAESAMLEAP